MHSLSGRTILITGASSGLGAHFARIAAQAGARVVLAARRTERIEMLARELCDSGAQALAVAMDVTSEASVIAGLDSGEAGLGPVDTVIANAGVSVPGRSTEAAADAIASLFDTNLYGTYFTAREGAKRMIAAGSRESGRGRILMIGSITAAMPGAGESAYSASKAAVARLGRNFAKEWGRLGVNVNVIQPGYIRTELSDEWFASEGGRAQIAAMPRRRLRPITSLDDMVLYLCSDASLHMTGSIVTLDDGQLL
jgi:NAD(P)-dependent dehydrogenase (short-subunit alcohol dehydrogenase family)